MSDAHVPQPPSGVPPAQPGSMPPPGPMPTPPGAIPPPTGAFPPPAGGAAAGGYPGAPSGKRVPAGVLGILLGGLGVHKFYLGYTTEGLLQLGATLITCGAASIVGLVEGIMYLTKPDAEFDATYVYGRKGWF